MKDKVDRWYELEKEIFDLLTKGENWSAECDCDNREVIKMIHEGEYDEIMTFCINCGGYCD